LTVVFTLKQPFGPFLGIFEVGSMPIVPKHLYEGTDFKTNPYNNAPIGTGPFMFKEWQKGSFVRLVKNPNYHVKGKPYIDEIYWQIIRMPQPARSPTRPARSMFCPAARWKISTFRASASSRIPA